MKSTEDIRVKQKEPNLYHHGVQIHTGGTYAEIYTCLMQPGHFRTLGLGIPAFSC